VRLAVAETVGAAWAAAHFADEGDCKMKNANCKMQIADSFETNLQFAICNLHFSISSMPIEALRIAADTTAVLRELGIETIDQLLALPREELASRFGEDLLRRLDQLTGQGRELIEPQRGLPALAASYALEEPTGDRSVLMQVLRQLVDQLSRQLAARDQGAMLLVGLLRCTDRQEVPLRIGLLQPSVSARQLLELIELHLETVRLTDEVDRVELRATVVGRLGERQRELFAGRWPTDSHQLAVLVNRLSSRLGCEHVLRAELRKSPLPERAVNLMPVTQLRVKKLQNANWESSAMKNLQFRAPPVGWSCNLQSPRPIVLYSEPQAREK